MREILFRGKRTDNDEWIFGNLEYNPITKLAFISVPQHIHVDVEMVDPETVCQYTGLTDKNGKKIFEGDIVFDDETYSLVRWDEGKAMFVIDDYGTRGCLMEYGWDEDAGGYGVVDTNSFDDFCGTVNLDFEVVGNIYDNPDLLTTPSTDSD